MQHTIEDCLEIVAGLQADNNFKLDRLDGSITLSIAKQVFRGISLSDKQYELMKLKLVKYSDQFQELNIDIHDAVTRTKMPLRSIDRTKFIKIVDIEEVLDKKITLQFIKMIDNVRSGILTKKAERTAKERDKKANPNKVSYSG